MKYKIKPVEIEAYQYTGSFDDAPEWIKTALECGMLFYHSLAFGEKPVLMADTEVGTQFICVGAYIIKGAKNNVYVCEKDIFKKISEATYERHICKTTREKCSNYQTMIDIKSGKGLKPLNNKAGD